MANVKVIENKIAVMKEMMTAGTDVREIIKKHFSRSIQRYLAFLEKHKEEFSNFEEYFQLEKKSQAVKAIKKAETSIVNFSEYKIESMKKEELKKLNPDELGKLLIAFAPDLLLMLAETKNIKKINKFIDEKDNLIKLDDVLVVPEEFIKLPDAVSRNFRFSQKVVKEFDEVAAQYSQYTKQTLLNLALKEFADKYRKKK